MMLYDSDTITQFFVFVKKVKQTIFSALHTISENQYACVQNRQRRWHWFSVNSKSGGGGINNNRGIFQILRFLYFCKALRTVKPRYIKTRKYNIRPGSFFIPKVLEFHTHCQIHKYFKTVFLVLQPGLTLKNNK